MKNIYYIYHEPDILKYKNCNNVAKKVLTTRVEKFFPNITHFDKREKESQGSYTLICFDLASPLFDEDALKISLNHIDDLQENIKAVQVGLVGGTSVKYICKLEETFEVNNIKNLETVEFSFTSQFIYSTQLNLYKLKRQKIFKYLIDKFENIQTSPIKEFLEWCSTDEGIREVLSYGEDVELIEHKKCPYCDCSESSYTSDVSLHPVIGFLTAKSKYYPRCNKCGLIYLRYTFPDNELYKIYDTYETEIDVRETTISNITSQNTSHYENYIASFDYIEKSNLDIKSMLDIGCGRCQFVTLARDTFKNAKIKGIDFDIPLEFIDELNQNNIELERVNFLSNLSQEKEKYDLITMWEVIEHIPISQLKKTIEDVLNLLSDDGVFIISTPNFDDEYCKLFDFWSSMPIHHLSVFSEKWLSSFFNDLDAEVIGVMHESVAFKHENGWASYASEFSRTSTDIASSKIFAQLIHNEELLNSFNDSRRVNAKGSEIIMVLQCQK